MVQVVFGRRGSGKSVLSRELLAQAVKSGRKIGVMVDTLLEHVDLPQIDIHSLRLLVSGGYCSVVRVAVPDVEHFGQVRDALRDTAEQSPGVVLAIDEVSYWTKPNQTAPALSDLIRYGRHWRVDLLGVARRAAETSRELTSQADELYTFAVHEPRDLAYFGEIMPAEVCAKIPALGQYEYIKYQINGTWDVCKPVQI
jgi:hypothetical protein